MSMNSSTLSMFSKSVTVWLKESGVPEGGIFTEGVYSGVEIFTSGSKRVQFSAKFTAAVASTMPNP